MNSNNKKIYFWAVISKILTVLMSLVATALVNRALGVVLKGEYAYITNLVNILLVIFSFGIGMSYSTFKRRDDSSKLLTEFISLIFYQSLFFLGISILLWGLKFKYVAVIMILTVINIFKYNLLYITAVVDVKKRDKNNIIYKIVYLLLVIIGYVFLKNSLGVMLLIFFLDSLITSLGLFFSYKFKIVSLKCVFKMKELKNIYKIGIISMLMQLMISLNYNLDVLILKHLSTSYYTGLYSVSVTLGNMLWIIPDAFKDILFFKTSKKDSIEEINFLVKINLIISVIIIVVFLFLGKWFIEIMFGKEFSEAFIPTLCLFIGCLSMIIFKLIHPLYIAKGNQAKILIILLTSVIINIILNIIFIPQYNMIGAALSSVLSYSLCAVILLKNYTKEYQIKLKDVLLFSKNDVNKVLKYIKGES